MTGPLWLLDGRLPDGSAVDLCCSDGIITAIEPARRRDAEDGIDCGGGLLGPAFTDGHLHLDKTFAGLSFVPHRPGESVAERIAAERSLRADIPAPVSQRGAALIGQIVGHGTLRLRSHVDIDPDCRLDHLHQLLALRERFADLVDIQIVAFPQSGILRSPGIADLMDEALRLGADLVGGLDPVGYDGDMAGHLDAVFALADRHGVGVDLHLHDGGETGLETLRAIAERTAASGLGGHVAVSHAFALGEPIEIGPTLDALARHGVAIMTNGPGPVPMPPVMRLRAAGVTVFAGSDNIRDAWSPYGDGDMLHRAAIIGYRQGANTDAELAALYDIVTGGTARALGYTEGRLSVGAPANLVVMAEGSPQEAVVGHGPRRAVLRAGRVVARDGTLGAAWRDAIDALAA